MERKVFEWNRVHPAAKEKIAAWHRDLIEEVEAAIAKHDVVVVGMAQNPHPRRARRLLRQRGIDHLYLEYGSYLSMWRRRSALKMWTGWPTFPMIWVKGIFVGGADDLAQLLATGELDRMVGRG
jgi:glutaredoxin-related protein